MNDFLICNLSLNSLALMLLFREDKRRQETVKANFLKVNQYLASNKPKPTFI